MNFDPIRRYNYYGSKMLLQIVMGTMIPLLKWEHLNWEKDPEEWERWIRIISRNNIRDTANIVEWERYWSERFETLI